MEKIIFFLIISIILFDFIFERFLDYLNLKNWSPKLPQEAIGIYDAEKYKKSQEYYKVNHNFSILTSTFSIIVMLLMLFFNGFAFIDFFARSITNNPIFMAILFFGIIGLASDIIGIPFSLYKMFVIEEKFGFNKATLKTFLLDKLKGYMLGILIGGPLLAIIVWIYSTTGEHFWIYVWITVSVFTLFASMFYASVILPLFNKLTPLPTGELREAIESYCKKVNFKLNNIFIMDGSKRSSKANAFFSGLGANKRIVLYDTLIEKHSTEELVAILAHEVGHYKKKHTQFGLILGMAQTGIMLYIMSLAINSPSLSKALGVEQTSFHIGFLAFGLLYSPLSALLGVAMNIFSRKHEFEADNFAASTYFSLPLQTALKKLSVDNLSNLKPHPIYVFVHYSHPPLLERLRELKKI